MADDAIPSVISSSKGYQQDDKNVYYDFINLDLVTGPMLIQVGDNVAFSCESAKKDKDATWNPWTTPWSPAQVLAIFYDTEKKEYNALVRWFYRQLEMTPSKRKKAQSGFPNNKTIRSKAVIETDVMDIMKVQKILGKVILTSKGKGFKSLESRIQKDNQHALLFCKLLYKFEGDICETVDDWSSEPEEEGPLQRVIRGYSYVHGIEGQDAEWLARMYVNCVAEREICSPTTQKRKSLLTSTASSPPGKRRKKSAQSSAATSVSSSFSATESTRTMNTLKKTSRERGKQSRPSTSSTSGMITTVEESDEYIDEEKEEDAPIGPTTLDLWDTTPAGRSYFRSVSIRTQPTKCAKELHISKSNISEWVASVGDIVCIQDDEAALPKKCRKLNGRHRNPWYPFQVPWSCYQILSVYTEFEVVNLEVRQFLRSTSLNEHALEMTKIPIKENEVFETFNIKNGVSAKDILGRTQLTLAHHNVPCGVVDDDSNVPVAELCCRRIYYNAKHHLQPLFCGGTTPKQWYHRLIERGLKSSPIIQKDGNLKIIVESIYNCRKVKSLIDELQASTVPTNTKSLKPLWSDEQEALFLSTQLIPQWQYYFDADNICHVDDRKQLSWTASVGDLVAFHFVEDTPPKILNPSDQSHFPYTDQWIPCQILAISVKNGVVSFEIRRLFRSVDSDVEHSRRKGFDTLYEIASQSSTQIVSADSLLGPLIAKPLQQRPVPPFLPHSLHYFGGVLPSSSETNRSKDEVFNFAAVVERGIRMSKSYENRIDLNEVLEKVLSDTASFDQGPHSPPLDTFGSPVSRASLPERERRSADAIRYSRRCDQKGSTFTQLSAGVSPTQSVATDATSLMSSGCRIQASGAPLHFDKSSRRVYFTEMIVEPTFELYVVKRRSERQPWNVKLGDTVALHHEYGGATHHLNKSKCNSYHPFKVPWAVAEIVAIWKEYEDKDEFPTGIKSWQRHGADQRGDLQLEIRWFWRKRELPGVRLTKNETPFICEEAFETDHIDRCTAASLLAPTKLISHPDDYFGTMYQSGMPVPEFICNRFWSYHRRSIIPFTSITARKARSMMYSECMVKDTVLRDKVESVDWGRLPKCTTPLDIGTKKASAWKVAFQQAVGNLSLTQASEDALGKGVTLIGRQQEQNDIASFLRNAINGAHSASPDGTTRPSMFVAGPPGTGKSVSVCSTIGRLRHEQIRGKLPDFDFFSLNGMEMRNPLEAYVKLWEDISGNAKERLSPEAAATKLERYFSGLVVKGAPERSVIVLMLDEIDYLVTRKQTVLYNFFDWPKRSFETPDCPRLIVIGISNTVNLPSTLKPSVRSRLGGCRCDFKSYNVQDIVEILTSKIQPKKSSYQVFDKDAILFAARKIAVVTGDIRKALQTCKAAAEAVLLLVESGIRKDEKSPDRPVVRIKDVQRITMKKLGFVMSNAIATASPFEVLVLVSLAALTRHSGRQTGGFDIMELVTKIEAVANASGKDEYTPALSFHEVLDILNRLAETRLVRLQTEKSSAHTFRASQGGSGGAWPVISLNIDDSDILSALKHGPHEQLVERQLSSVYSLYCNT